MGESCERWNESTNGSTSAGDVAVKEDRKVDDDDDDDDYHEKDDERDRGRGRCRVGSARRDA